MSARKFENTEKCRNFFSSSAILLFCHLFFTGYLHLKCITQNVHEKVTRLKKNKENMHLHETNKT